MWLAAGWEGRRWFWFLQDLYLSQKLKADE